MSVCGRPGEGRARAQERAPDPNVSPTAKPEATEVSPNKGILSVVDDFAQEVSGAGPRFQGPVGGGGLHSCILGEERAGGPRVLGQSPGPRPCPPQIATCHSRNGNPAPQIMWYRDGQQLEVPMEVNSGELPREPSPTRDGAGWRRPPADRDRPPPPFLPAGYMTSRMVREASGLQSLTSTLYLRLQKADRDASFHCSVRYHLPAGQHGRLDSPPFRLTLHCESLPVPTFSRPPGPQASRPRPDF